MNHRLHSPLATFPSGTDKLSERAETLTSRQQLFDTTLILWEAVRHLELDGVDKLQDRTDL